MENNIVPINNPLGNITRIEYHGQPVLTTSQLAEYYETKTENLKLNFRNNAERFVKGKHYFKLEGDDLATFKNEVKNFNLVAPKVNALYLWTKRGCARHCKSVGTDKAWEVFETLEDTYFNQVVDRDSPLPSINNYKLAIALTKLAAHADDPYMKKRLVAEAANRLLNEEVFLVPEMPAPVVQLTLFK